jgi:hypothetical protein
MPPMWYTFAQMRRIASGAEVGIAEKMVKRRLITGSERMSIATVRFAAVTVAASGSGYSLRLMPRCRIHAATAMFAHAMEMRNQR